MNPRKTLSWVIALIAVSAMPAAQAASISLTPASSTVALSNGTTTLELFMDFTNDPTIGGGIDLDLSGPISLGPFAFAPSTYFTTIPDQGFSGFGTVNADADFEIHFGNFAGLSGANKLGDITVNLLGEGTGNIAIAINTEFGSFFSTSSVEQLVSLNGAQVNTVPLPASAWLFATTVRE